jgi:hypothetical protein
MIKKSDWQTAYSEILEEGRDRLGPPPTAEQIEALREGKLPEEEAQRVRELLAYYPEMVRAMTEPIPVETAGLVTDEEVAVGLAKLKERIRHESAPVSDPLPLHRRRSRVRTLMRVAAVVVILAGGVLVYKATRRLDGLPVMLSADGQLAASRGSAQTPHQLSTETDYVLRPAFRPEREYRRYRLELFDLSADPPRSIETWRSVEPAPDGSFPVELSTKGFAEGRYQLVLYGVDEEPVRLATYTIRLTAP